MPASPVLDSGLHDLVPIIAIPGYWGWGSFVALSLTPQPICVGAQITLSCVPILPSSEGWTAQDCENSFPGET